MSDAPQVEDGNFTRIHNEILEVITLGKFTIYEYKCLLYLLRKTYGWQKKEDANSLAQWEDGTGINKRHVARTIENLVKRKVVNRQKRRGRGQSTIYGFNKYFDTWTEKVPVRVPIKKVPVEVPISEEKVRVQVPEKVRVEVPTKESKEITSSNSDDSLALLRLVSDTFMYLDRDPKRIASVLIDEYGWDRCKEALVKTKEQHEIQIHDSGRGILAPMAYMRSIMQNGDSSRRNGKGENVGSWSAMKTEIEYE